MKLYANGCSFTWGGVLIDTVYDHGKLLDEHNTSDLNKHRLSITWPKHLSDYLQCSEFHNHGMGCGSNSRIVRKTLDFFVNKIHNNEDLSDWVAVIQWTEPSRFEFFDVITNSWAIAKHDVVLFENPGDSDFTKDFIDQYYRYNTDLVFGNQMFSQIVTLGNFFKQHGIKYVFTTNSHEFFLTSFDEEKLKYCNDNFVWYNNDILKCSICDMAVETCESSAHPSELGHQQLATNLFEFLSSQK